MTEKEKTVVKEFFDLKAKQLICQVWIALNQKPGYVADEIGLMTKVLEVQSKQDRVESEILELVKANAEFIRNADLPALSREPEFKVSITRQRELSKDLIGSEATVEEMLERLQSRGY